MSCIHICNTFGVSFSSGGVGGGGGGAAANTHEGVNAPSRSPLNKNPVHTSVPALRRNFTMSRWPL